MGIISGLLIGGAAALGIGVIINGIKEDRKRRGTPCYFIDGVSKEQFQDAVAEAAKHIKRLKSFLCEQYRCSWHRRIPKRFVRMVLFNRF